MATVTKFASSNTVVTTGWTAATSAYADDAAYATAAPAKNVSVTSDFGFADFTTGDIPDGSVINSVTFEFQFKSSTTGSTGAVIGIQGRNGGSLLGAESTFGMSTTDVTQTKQYTSGIALADLRNAGTLLVRVRGARAASNTAVTWSVDYVKVTVNYTVAFTLVAGSGSFTETGNGASFLAGRELVADTGTFAATGNNATLAKGRTLACAAGSFALTGNDAALTYTPASGYTMAADAGAFAVAGSNTGLTTQRKLVGASGSFAVTGRDAALVSDRYLTASAGAFAVTGPDPGLAAGRVFSAELGSFLEAGNSAGLPVDRRLTGGTGSFSLTGNAAELTLESPGQYALTAGAGSFAVSGADVGLYADRVLGAAPGTFAAEGSSAGLLGGWFIVASTEDLAFTGHDAELTYDGGAGAWTLDAETGAFALTGSAAGPSGPPSLQTASAPGRKAFTGAFGLLEVRWEHGRRVVRRRVHRINRRRRSSK